MAKPAHGSRKAAPAKAKPKPRAPTKASAAAAAEPPAAGDATRPGRKLAGVVLSIVAQRLLVAGVKRLVRRLR